MALAELLKPKTPAEVRRRVADSLVTAQDVLERARKLYAELSADDEVDGRSPSAPTVKAAEALATAKREVDRLTGVLQTLDARSQSSMQALARQAQSEAWDQAERLAEQRLKKARLLERAMADFAAVYADFLNATSALEAGIRAATALVKGAPSIPDAAAARLMNPQVVGAVRVELRRLGVEWAALAPEGVVNLPVFLPPFADTPGLVRQWRDSANG